jgi:hypothetical protein
MRQGCLFRELRKGSYSITVTHDDAKPPPFLAPHCISFARRSITEAQVRHELGWREFNDPEYGGFVQSLFRHEVIYKESEVWKYTE